MSIRLMTEVWRTGLEVKRKIVLLSLCDNSNDQGECYPSVQMMVGKCSLPERTIQLALAELEEDGFIKREFRTGRSTFYRIEDPQKWPSDPRSSCTPAAVAPPQQLHPTPAAVAPPPPQQLHPTPAAVAPITIKEPSVEPSGNQKRGVGEGGQAPSPPQREGLETGPIPLDWKPPDWVNGRIAASGKRLEPQAHHVAHFIAHHQGLGTQWRMRRWAWDFVGWCIRQAVIDETNAARKGGSNGAPPAVAQRALVAWTEVREAVSKGKSPAKWSDELTQQVLDGCGGMISLRDARTQDMPHRQRDFERLFVVKAASAVAA